MPLRNAPNAEEQILEWFVQTCFALKHVHERKVLHRDLKTQNIFLMSNGHVKLGDFGIARVLDATKDYARTMVGTPYYLSPEIIEDRPYNFKSDIWSLGVVLYEMTTLKHPFDADSLVILASKILKDQYPPPDASYSPDLLSLIRSMLCKDAPQRPLINKILCYSFLQDIMQHANTTYHLGLDLSEFAKAAAAVPRTPQAPPEEQDASMTSKTAEASTEAAEEEYEEEFEDYSGSEDGGEHPQSDLRPGLPAITLLQPLHVMMLCYVVYVVS
ncbi:NEK1 [Symbiodinium natans]|uniref:non-specific serine/threonine protein kinase n=1 Tax=Symbiodinium natans TaxID=878477 RepID=A0A812URR7_9DINO|nr:NEK1 [Symbiodinium natans]